MAEIQARHDRAFIRELSEYLRQNPKADDRDQAYAALFNKAIEHDWFSEAEEQGRQYLKSDPDGPVKALAQIILTMARARPASLTRHSNGSASSCKGSARTSRKSSPPVSPIISPPRPSPPASSRRRARSTRCCSSRFSESPNLRQKVQARPEAAGQGRQAAPSFASEDINGKTVRLDGLPRQVRPGRFLGDLVRPCIAELPRLQAAYRTYHDAGFEIIGISLDESKTAVVDFAKATQDSLAAAPQRQRLGRSGRGLRRELDPGDLPDRSRRDDHPARPARQGARRDAGRLIKRPVKPRRGGAERNASMAGSVRGRPRPPAPAQTGRRPGPARSLKSISTIFSLWTSRPISSLSRATILRVRVSITSPVDG